MRRSGAVLVLVLLVGGCGDGDATAEGQDPAGAAPSTAAAADGDPAEDTSFVATEVDEDSMALAAAIVADHGDEAGFVAFVLALERGYSIDQVADAVAMGTLDTRGVIVVDGVPVESAHQRAGVIALPDDDDPPSGAVDRDGERALVLTSAMREVAGSPRLVGAQAPIQPLRLLERLRVVLSDSFDPEFEAGLQLVGLIASLARTGYSVPQIVESLLLGWASVVAMTGCAFLWEPVEGGDIRVVAPAERMENPCSVTVARLGSSESPSSPPAGEQRGPDADRDQPDAGTDVVYAQSLEPFGLDPGSLLSVTVRDEQAAVRVVLHDTVVWPNDGCATEQSLTTGDEAQTVDVTGSTIRATLIGVYVVRRGSCPPDVVVGVGEEEASFVLDLALDATRATGTLSISSPSLDLAGAVLDFPIDAAVDPPA